MQKVNGIGGVFFRARDPKALSAWYAEHLGIPTQDWGGASFVWSEQDRPESASTAVSSPVASTA